MLCLPVQEGREMKPYGRSMLAGGLCLGLFTWMCAPG